MTTNEFTDEVCELTAFFMLTSDLQRHVTVSEDDLEQRWPDARVREFAIVKGFADDLLSSQVDKIRNEYRLLWIREADFADDD